MASMAGEATPAAAAVAVRVHRHRAKGMDGGVGGGRSGAANPSGANAGAGLFSAGRRACERSDPQARRAASRSAGLPCSVAPMARTAFERSMRICFADNVEAAGDPTEGFDEPETCSCAGGVSDEAWSSAMLREYSGNRDILSMV